MQTKYSSLWLSKKLKEGGCEFLKDIDNKCWYYGHYPKEWRIGYFNKDEIKDDVYPALDLLWDVCVRYANRFFGEEIDIFNIGGIDFNLSIKKGNSWNIIALLQQDKIKEAEEYIWENCLFNDKNK